MAIPSKRESSTRPLNRTAQLARKVASETFGPGSPLRLSVRNRRHVRQGRSPFTRPSRNRSSVLRHRGPDEARTWISPDGDVALGHARLSVIDLATGQQPLTALIPGWLECREAFVGDLRPLLPASFDTNRIYSRLLDGLDVAGHLSACDVLNQSLYICTHLLYPVSQLVETVAPSV